MARPKLVTAAAAEEEIHDFEHFAQKAADATKPYKLRLPVFEPELDESGAPVLDEDGEPKLKRTGTEVVEIEAPTTKDMRAVREAQLTQDVDVLADAIFGVYAQRVLDLIEDADYLVINGMVQSVMEHYGRRLEDLGES